MICSQLQIKTFSVTITFCRATASFLFQKQCSRLTENSCVMEMNAELCVQGMSYGFVRDNRLCARLIFKLSKKIALYPLILWSMVWTMFLSIKSVYNVIIKSNIWRELAQEETSKLPLEEGMYKYKKYKFTC